MVCVWYALVRGPWAPSERGGDGQLVDPGHGVTVAPSLVAPAGSMRLLVQLGR